MMEEKATGRAWSRVGVKAHHGIDIPLFSLHSQKSCGIGEYSDLPPLVDWCKNVGFDVIMLLPMNDTHHDPSPYNALSASALHPIYLGLASLPFVEEFPDLLAIIESLQKLPKTERIDYAHVLQRKEHFMRLYFSYVWNRVSEDVERFAEECPHIKTYALFKTLKENHEGECWMNWPEEIRQLSATQFKQLLQLHKESVSYHLLIQYFCAQQLSTVKEYAESQGVYIKGDIPILISPDSADVWSHPEYFDLHYAAGAPPDQYTPDGQYWGFPIYKWAKLIEDQFGWWKERLNYANRFYHIYRIDHVIGFFRIWAIKRGDNPKQGIFIPDTEWEAVGQGRLVLETLTRSSPMLPIAEDLGWMPEGASECLQELGICGTRVLRWERNYHGDGSPIPFEDYNPLSMSTVSTHDSPTLAQWWRDAPDEAAPFAHMLGIPYQPELSREDRFLILERLHLNPSYFHINLIGEYLALYPELVHPNLADERINMPGIISPLNWSYRLRPSVDEILAHQGLRQMIQKIVNPAG